MLSIYPACFFEEEKHYSVIFPDFNYLSKSAETAWCNIPSGEYEAGFKAKLTAASQNSNAKLVLLTLIILIILILILIILM